MGHLSQTLRLFWLLVLGLTLTACGDPQIDLASDKAYGESIKKIYETVPGTEREEFLRNFGAVLSEIKDLGINSINEPDMLILYDMVKLFAGEEGIKQLRPISGLTAKEITKRGRAIRQKNLSARQISLKADLDKQQKAVREDEAYLAEQQKVELTCTEIEVIEAVNFKKPTGAVGFLEALVTVKNNSSLPIQKINGQIQFADEMDDNIGRVPLYGYLKPVELEMNDYFDSEVNIAPGDQWQGRVFLRFHNPDKKRHPFPVPAGRQYRAAISEVELTLITEDSRTKYDIKLRANRLENTRAALKAVEEELAALKK